MNTNDVVSDIHDDISKILEEIGGQIRSVRVYPSDKQTLTVLYAQTRLVNLISKRYNVSLRRDLAYLENHPPTEGLFRT